MRKRKRSKYRRFTQRELLILEAAIEGEGLGAIAKELGRTRLSIYRKARRLGILGERGCKGWKAVAAETGYDKNQVRRAAKALGQVWRRDASHGFAITPEQRAQIVEFLGAEGRGEYRSRRGRAHDAWAIAYDECAGCGTRGSLPRERHAARGFCVRCYDSRQQEWQGLHRRCKRCGTNERTGTHRHKGQGLCGGCHREARGGLDGGGDVRAAVAERQPEGGAVAGGPHQGEVVDRPLPLP